MAEDARAEITLREVYNEIMNLKMELAGTPWQLKDHEKRIRDLEMRIYTAAGVFSVGAIFVTQLINYLTKG